MPNETTEAPKARTEIVLASTALSQRLGVEKGHMIETLKAQCFQNPSNVTDTQLATFIQVAQSLNLNPLLPGQLYAYPGKNGGIVPMIGPDGVFKLLASNPDIEGWTVKHDNEGGEASCTAVIKHKRLGEISYTAFLSEWKVQSNPNWASRPRHMLGVRALKHAARQIIHGIPFDIEEHEIIEMQEAGHIEPPKRAVLPPKNKGVSAMKNVTPDPVEPAPAESKKDEAPVPYSEAHPDEMPGDPPKSEVVPQEAPTPAQEAAAKPTHPTVPQPEGWPKRIGAIIRKAKEVEMTVEPAAAGPDGLIPAKKMPTLLLELDSPEGEEEGLGQPVPKAVLSPYIYPSFQATYGADFPKTRVTLTVERWPSLSKPGQTLHVATVMNVWSAPGKEEV